LTRDEAIARGACLCGGVRYEVHGPLRPVVACHCRQCQKTSGHFVAATRAHRDNLRLLADDDLSWYRSSKHAERGFCRVCGSSLFWRRDGDDGVSIMAGSLERPTGLRLVEHIFTESAGDYYAIDDGLPRKRRGGASAQPSPRATE